MASTYVWLTRCIPAFSIAIVVAFLVHCFIFTPYGKGEPGKHHGEDTIPQLILAAYVAFLHVLSIAFPLRASWAMRYVLKATKATAEDIPTGRRRRVQSISIKNDQEVIELPVPLFAIILPAYKEDMATLEDTLRVLASHAQAARTYHVCLKPPSRQVANESSY